MQASNVASTTTQASSTGSLNSGGRDGLGLGSQLLAPPHREQGAAIVSMPQVYFCILHHIWQFQFLDKEVNDKSML